MKRAGQSEGEKVIWKELWGDALRDCNQRVAFNGKVFREAQAGQG